MNDLLFSRTELYDEGQECLLTRPKPDTTFCFTTECTANTEGHKKNRCFDESVLSQLMSKYGLLSSPFAAKHNVCFPWAIFEGKEIGNNSVPFAESQAANAAVRCIEMLGALSKLPGESQEYTLPIPCFTCKGEKWELWICYRSDRSGKNGSRHTYVITSFDIPGCIFLPRTNR